MREQLGQTKSKLFPKKSLLWINVPGKIHNPIIQCNYKMLKNLFMKVSKSCYCPTCVLLPVLFQTFGLFSESGQETDSFLGASVSNRPWSWQRHSQNRNWRGSNVKYGTGGKASFSVHRCGFNFKSIITINCCSAGGSSSCLNGWQCITSCLSGQAGDEGIFSTWQWNPLFAFDQMKNNEVYKLSETTTEVSKP